MTSVSSKVTKNNILKNKIYIYMIYKHMYVCIYVCMYVYMYVCMYIYIMMIIFIPIHIEWWVNGSVNSIHN